MNRIDEFLGRDKSGYPQRAPLSVALLLQLVPVFIVVRLASPLLHPLVEISILATSLIVTLSEAFRLNSYATLTAPLGAGGIMVGFIFREHWQAWAAGALMLTLGIVCGIQHFRWRDRRANNDLNPIENGAPFSKG